MTADEIPAGIDGDRLKERGIKELQARERERINIPPEHSTRRKYRGSTMLRRLWATPGHLRVGQKDR